MEVVDNLKLIVMDNCKELGDLVNWELKNLRRTYEDYRVPIELTRFSDGEGKATLKSTIRKSDVYILTDTHNHSITYKMYDYEHHMSPDEHFQDLKRAIYATAGHASSLSVVMPFLYESRQHRRRSIESLDCAAALQELRALGVNELITFDAHDPNIQNAVPTGLAFDNFYPTNEILKSFIKNEDINLKNIQVISPDSGALARARFLANIIGTPFSAFEKSRNYDLVVNGQNPVESDRYLGDDITGKDIIVTDDMLASGGSLLRVSEDLKKRGANRIYFFVTFGLFTQGYKIFDEAYEKGLFNGIYSTNLTYVPDEIKNKKWFHGADCSLYLARIIDSINKGESITNLIEDHSAINAYRKSLIRKK